MTILSLIVTLPFLAALGLLFAPRRYNVVFRGVTLLTTLVVALLGVMLFLQFPVGDPGFHFVSFLPGLGAEALGIRCRLGVDGLSVGLVMMGTLVAFAAACAQMGHRPIGAGHEPSTDRTSGTG